MLRRMRWARDGKAGRMEREETQTRRKQTHAVARIAPSLHGPSRPNAPPAGRVVSAPGSRRELRTLTARSISTPSGLHDGAASVFMWSPCEGADHQLVIFQALLCFVMESD